MKAAGQPLSSRCGPSACNQGLADSFLELTQVSGLVDRSNWSADWCGGGIWDD